MIFWCIYLFVVCGFEHSIANMTLFSLETMNGVSSAAFGKMMANLGAVTLGNILGGMALALAYWIIAIKPVHHD
jgi:nitrite transporter NirC